MVAIKNKIQVKRTTVSGRTPNVSDPSNTQYIDTGELALNLADGYLYTSNGSSLITVGAAQKNITACTANFSQSVTISDSNSTLVINSSTVFAGNTFTNTIVNTTFIAVSNTTSNSEISPQIIFSGNSTTNAQINMVGGASSVGVVSYTAAANGVITIQTSADHGQILAPGLTVTTQNTSPLWDGQILKVQSIPTTNTLTFSLGKSITGSKASIASVSRSNGVATAVTSGPNYLANQQVITITGFGKQVGIDLSRFNATNITANVINSTAFSYPNLLPNKTLTITSAGILSRSGSYIGPVELLCVTFTPHGLNVGSPLTFTNVGSINVSGPPFNIYGPNLNYGTWLVSTVYSSTVFAINYYYKSMMTNIDWPGNSPIVFSSATVTSTFDTPSTAVTTSTTITTGAFSNSSLNPSTSNASFIIPSFISVANSSSQVKITPTSVYVGNTYGTTGVHVTIDAVRGAVFNKPGSILQSYIDGSGFNSVSVQSLDGPTDPNTASFFANSSLITVGNNSISSVIASDYVGTSNLIVSDSTNSVFINSSSISLQPSNVYIDAYQTVIPGSLIVNTSLNLANTSLLIVNNNIGNTNDVLVSTSNGVIWSPAANNTYFVGNVSAANVVSNAQLIANLSNYQTTAGLSANVATLTSNNTTFVGNVSAANVVSNAQLIANLANYVSGFQLSSNLANYQTTAGLSANVATLTANNTSFVGSVSAANVVSNAQLQANLANYASITSASFSGNVSVGGNLSITGQLFVAGNTTIVNTTIITSSDLNLILANGIGTSALANGAGLIVGTYANIVYSSSASGWQSNVNIVPAANNLSLGNTTSVWNLNANNISAVSINAASHTVGTSFIANSSQVTLTTPLSANGSVGTAGYVLTSNGTTGSPYWTVAASSVNTAAIVSFTNTAPSSNAVSGAVLIAGGLGVNGNIYTGNVVGYSYNNISAAYTFYNSSTGTLDTVFG